MLTFKANSYAAGQDPEGARAQGGDHRALRLCAPPDVFGTLLFSVGTALLFGLWWGLLAVALFGVLIAVRAVLEEETLKAELEGYADYAAHVRYRLVPLLW